VSDGRGVSHITSNLPLSNNRGGIAKLDSLPNGFHGIMRSLFNIPFKSATPKCWHTRALLIVTERDSNDDC
jgi:hypothetical protein